MNEIIGITTLMVEQDGAITVRQNTPINLKYIQQAVGGIVEAIYGRDWIAYVNEDAKRNNTPVNIMATKLAELLNWKGKGHDALRGNVLFVGPPDNKGRDTSVREFVARMAHTVIWSNAYNRNSNS